MTREESQQRTREQLLEAARERIAKHGIAAASVRNISEAAGYSLGAFYSNFTDKEALLVELMEDQLLRLGAQFNEIVRNGRHNDLEHALAAVVEWLVGLHANRTWSQLMLEFQIHSNRHPSFSSRFNKRRASYLASFANGFEMLFERYGRVPTLTPMHMAIGFIALWNGFSIQKPGEYPIAPGEVYLAFLRTLFAGAAAKAA